MADSTSFFTSDGFTTSVNAVSAITTGFLKNANAEIQGKYATALKELENNAALTESERQQKIAALNAQYQEMTDAAKAEARADYLKWGILALVGGLAAFGMWLAFGYKKK
ncbi:MAG: hypothetical protein QM669_12360 [Siphonobacter sp.]